MDQHVTFSYTPVDRNLTQIRLISILPEAEGPVRCTIRHIDLDTNRTPDYRALSYTWGPTSPTRGIYIDGRLLIVSLNLYDFLLAFRRRLYSFRGGGLYEDELQWLWIDQICIDQSVVEERNHQVGIMSSIYKRATYVYVWLGSSDERTEAAMQTLKSSFRQYHDYRHTQATESNHRSDIDESSSNGGAQEMEAGSVEALQRFFQNSYWERLWIVQEIMLARYIRIICGDTLLSWEELRRFCVSGRSYVPPGASSDVPAQVVWLAEHALSAKQYSYISLLRTFSKNKCRDPRDKVYGLQGLLVDKDKTSADYSKAVSAVFEDAAATLIEGANVVAMNSYRTIVQEFEYCRTVPQLFSEICMSFRKEQESRIQLEVFEVLMDLDVQMGLGHETVSMKTLMEIIDSVWTHMASVYVRDYERYHGHQQAQKALTAAESRGRMVDHQMDVLKQKQASRWLDMLYQVLASMLHGIAYDLNIEMSLGAQYTWLNDVEDPEPLINSRYQQQHGIRKKDTFETFPAMEEFRSAVESTTKHMMTNTWQYDLVISPHFHFPESSRDTFNSTASGSTTHIEYTLRRGSSCTLLANPNGAQLTIKLQPLVDSARITEVKSMFRGFSSDRGSLILSVTTDASPVLDSAVQQWDLSFDFDLNSCRPTGTRSYASCIVFRAEKPPKQLKYQHTPEYALAQDGRVQAVMFRDLGDNRVIQIKSGRLTLWRLAAVGC